MMSTTTPPESTSPLAPSAIHPRLALMRPTLALLKKEIRELLPAGVVFPCILGVIYLFMVLTYIPREKESRVGEYLNNMFNGPILVAIPIIALCLAGILIGGVQFFKESKIDAYAFLVHRPLSRSRIYICRVLAAHAALIFILLLPTFAFYSWAASYEVATPVLLKRGLLTTLTGLIAASASYFFGVLIVSRVSAKWYGSLFMPIMWAAAVSLLPTNQEDHRWYILIAILGLIPMFIAGHGAFTTFSQIQAQRWYARLSLGLVVLIGQIWLLALLLAAACELLPAGSLETDWVVPVIQKDGTPALVQRGNLSNSLNTIDGQFRRNLSSNDGLPPLCGMVHVPVVSRRYRPNWAISGNQNALDYAIFKTEINGQKYQLSCRGRNFIEVTSDYGNSYTYGGSPVGIIDREGLKLGTTRPSAAFDGPAMLLNNDQIIVDSKIYQINSQAKLSLIGQIPDSLRYTDVALFNHARRSAYQGIPAYEETSNDLFVATSQHLYQIPLPVRSENGKITATREWAREPGNWEMTLIWQSKDDLVIRYDALDHSHSFFVFTSTGRRIEVPPPHQVTPPMRYWPWGDIIPRSSFGIGHNMITATELVRRDQSWQWNHDVLLQQLWQIPEAKVLNTCTLIISTLAAAVTWLLMSRQSFTRGRKILWSTLAFICGPAILLLRPVIVPARILEPCPDCHKKRPVELTTCPHCNNPWPSPPRDGREIIA